MNRTSDRLLRWTAFIGLALAILTGIAIVLAIRSQVQVHNAAPNLDQLPSIALTRAETELNETLLELRTLDMNVDSTAQAISRLTNTASGEGQVSPEAVYARNYLLKHEVPESERRWLIYMLLSPVVKMANEDDFKLLEKYGRPSDGPALARKIPPRACVPQWFALLDKWQTAPEPITLVDMLVLDLGVELRREYVARKNWPNAGVLAAIVDAQRRYPGSGNAVSLLDDADARAIRIVALLAGRWTPLPDSVEALAAVPPSPATRTIVIDSLLAEFKSLSKLEQVAVYVPLLESWNEPALWSAVEKIIADEAKEIAPSLRRGEVSVQRHMAIEQLVWRYERKPTEPLGRLLAALGPPKGIPSLWLVAEFAKRNPDLAKQAGIDMTSPTPIAGTAAGGARDPRSGTGAGGPGAAGAATGAPVAAVPIDIDEAIGELQSGLKPRLLRACAGLSVTPPDDARRVEVLAAITPHLSRNDEVLDVARITYCQWAGPSSLSIVEGLAMNSRFPPAQAAAIRALLRLDSQRLHIIARQHVTSEPWTPELIDAWAAGKEKGEEALCSGLIAVRALRPVSKDALSFLGNHGGSRSLTVLKNLGAAPGTDGAAIEAAIKKLETRLKPNAKS